MPLRVSVDTLADRLAAAAAAVGAALTWEGVTAGQNADFVNVERLGVGPPRL